MISANEADNILLDHIIDFGIEKVSLENASQRILREFIFADRDMPPFNRVAMDGIAIQLDSFKNKTQIFDCEAIQQAGSPPITLKDRSKCIEVMTGAVMPIGVDTVIKFEDTAKIGESYQINLEDIKPNVNIHFKGSDVRIETELLRPGVLLNSPQIGILASTGKAQPLVSIMPRIAIISTGNELVDVNETPLPHQIRKSNIHAVYSKLKATGFDKITKWHLLDTKEDIDYQLRQCVDQNDVFILSGGVSMGKFDFIPERLIQLGVNKHFHKIKQKPGKPFWFGTLNNEKIFYALPGNPVSTLICLYRYVIPHLFKCLQSDKIIEKKTLKAEWNQKSSLTLFQAVKEKQNNYVQFVPQNGSGDYASLAYSTGFIEKPEGLDFIAAGDTAYYYKW